MVDTMDLMLDRMENAQEDEAVALVSERVMELKHLNSEQWESRTLIRDILDGGVSGLRAILGRDFTGDDPRVPAPNLMVSGLTTLAQKLGTVPRIRVDPPPSDTDNARKAADKRARIAAHYDRAARMELQVPQLGRWLPGYGFVPIIVEQHEDINGDPYPHSTVRDPYNAFPAQWGLDQQPTDIAFIHISSARDLLQQFPEHFDTIKALASGNIGSGSLNTSTASTHIGWQNQQGAGIEVYEYHNIQGTWWVVPEAKLLLSFVPNPLRSRPPFVVAKRFAFNKLVGQYDHVIGLMATIARMNVLSVIAAEDAVFAETIVSGDLRQGTTWNRGRDAVNFLEPNASATKLHNQVPQEVFQQIDRMERQLRVVSRYSPQDDGQSPISFATGRGLEELSTSPQNEVEEYFKVIRWAFTDLDSIRFEYDESMHPSREMQMTGVLDGASFTESYRPRTHIKGNYLTRRVHGAMASLDEPTKAVTMLNFLQAEVMDLDTVRENIDGIEDPSKIAERVRQKRLEDIMFEFLLARAEEGDVAAMEAVIEMMREGDIKNIMEEVFLEAEMEQQQQQQQPPVAEINGPPPDVQTVLARLTQAGETMGVQATGQI